MPKSKTKADTDPKIPLKWLNINQVWCQRGPKCPNISQNGPDKPTLAQQRPTQTTKGKNEADGAKTANHIFCESKIGFAHAPCPPHTPLPRAKLHQPLALFQRFPSSKYITLWVNVRHFLSKSIYIYRYTHYIIYIYTLYHIYIYTCKSQAFFLPPAITNCAAFNGASGSCCTASSSFCRSSDGAWSNTPELPLQSLGKT